MTDVIRQFKINYFARDNRTKKRNKREKTTREERGKIDIFYI